MTGFDAVNVIRLFDFYLASMFVLSLSRRYTVYWDTLHLLVQFRGRWPRLIDTLKAHHGVLVTAQVLRPLGVAVGLMLTQMICSRVIYPAALLTVGEAKATWWMVPTLIAAALPMVAVDTYFLLRVAGFDRASSATYLDKAEYWLSSRYAPALRVATLGYVDPRRIVDEEVKKSLAQLGRTVRGSAWWVALQSGCRVACGLTVWAVWAVRAAGWA